MKTQRTQIFYQMVGKLHTTKGSVFNSNYGAFEFLPEAKKKDSIRLVYLPIGYVFPLKFSSITEAKTYSETNPIDRMLSRKDRIMLRDTFLKLKKDNLVENTLIVLMGKSASGKDTLLNRMIYLREKLNKVTTFTSRPPRINEVDGTDYYFVTNEMFEDMISRNEFIEYRKYRTKFNGESATWYYGLHKIINNITGKNPSIAILTPNALDKIYKEFGRTNVKLVYLDVDHEIRLQRAIKRGSFSMTEWLRREKSDKKMFDKWLEKYKPDLILTDKDDLDTQVKKIKALITKY